MQFRTPRDQAPSLHARSSASRIAGSCCSTSWRVAGSTVAVPRSACGERALARRDRAARRTLGRVRAARREQREDDETVHRGVVLRSARSCQAARVQTPRARARAHRRGDRDLCAHRRRRADVGRRRVSHRGRALAARGCRSGAERRAAGVVGRHRLRRAARRRAEPRRRVSAGVARGYAARARLADRRAPRVARARHRAVVAPPWRGRARGARRGDPRGDRGRGDRRGSAGALFGIAHLPWIAWAAETIARGGYASGAPAGRARTAGRARPAGACSQVAKRGALGRARALARAGRARGPARHPRRCGRARTRARRVAHAARRRRGSLDRRGAMRARCSRFDGTAGAVASRHRARATRRDRRAGRGVRRAFTSARPCSRWRRSRCRGGSESLRPLRS